MPLRQCLLLFLISFNLFSEDLYIELEKEDETIWQASYPINSSSWEIDYKTDIVLPQFEYIQASAPFILIEEPHISEIKSNRWAGGFIYDKNERAGLVANWGSSIQPLHLHNVAFYSAEQSGVYTNLDWITGSRLSMSHSLFIADLIEMKNQWFMKTHSYEIRIEDIYRNKFNSSSDAYVLLEGLIDFEKNRLGIQGSYDSFRNEGDIHLLYSYESENNRVIGLKAGYSLAENRNINTGVYADFSNMWEWSIAAGYEKIIQPSFDFNETRDYTVMSDLYHSPHVYMDLQFKKNITFFSMDGSIVWRSLNMEPLYNSLGGEIFFSFLSDTKKRIPIGLSTGFAYNKHLVHPEDISAIPQWSGLIIMDIPLQGNWNINNTVTLDHNGSFILSFLINFGGTYVGDV